MGRPDQTDSQDFLNESRAARTGLPREILAYLIQNRKLWLLPILLVLLLFGLLLVLAGSAAGPFIYPLF